jgi:hypothetical protein
MSLQTTDSNPESIKNGSATEQEQDFGTSMADVMSGLDDALTKELSGKVPDKNDAAAQEADIKAKEESEKPKEDEQPPKESEKPKEDEQPPKESEKPPKESEKPKEDTDPDQEVLDAEPPGGAHASQETQINWRKLQEVAKAAKQKAAQAAQEAAELKAKLESSQGALPEEVEGELKYLRQKVAEFDLSSSPDFKSKYDSQLSTIEESLLKDFEAIEATGLPAAKDIKAKLKSALDQSGGLTNYNWSGLLDLCEKHKLVDGIQRRKIESKVANAETVEEQRQSELQKASEVFEQTRSATAQERQQLVKEMDSHIKEFTSKHDWTQAPKDPGKGATPEQKKEYEENLKFYQDGSTRFIKMVNAVLRTHGVVGGDGKLMPTPKEAVEIIFDSVRAMRQEKDLETKEGVIKSLENQVEKLEKELGEFKRAGNTSHRKTTPSQGSSSKVDKPTATTVRDVMSSLDEDLNNFIGES